MRLFSRPTSPLAAAKSSGADTQRSLPGRLAQSRGFGSALLVLAGFVSMAVLAPADAPGGVGLSLGAGSQGQDVLFRTMAAARVSVLFNLFTTGSVLLVGIPLGMLAGYRGGWVDSVLARLAEVVEVFPDLLFLILFAVAFRGSGLGQASGGLSLLWAVLVLVFGLNTARSVRGDTRQLKQAAFVLAARNLGLSEGRIFSRHIAPVVLVRMLPAAVFQMQAIAAAESALSYLGLGVQRAEGAGGLFASSWGSMLYEGQQVVMEQPFALLAPAACLALLLLALTVVGSRMQTH